MNRTVKVVDVFAATPLRGNPVAVVLDADGLDTLQMQAIAGWTNLSETTFLLPTEEEAADYRLRIFTPRSELPFAGHPTLGSAHAALEAGRVSLKDGRIVQECGVGLVTIAVTGEDADRKIALSLPPAKLKSVYAADLKELEAILGAPVDRTVPAAIVDVGAIWVVARVDSMQRLLSIRPDFNRSAAFEQRLGVTGITIFAPRHEGGTEIEVRSFAASQGVNEDPVCGSGNGSVAVFQHTYGLLPAGCSGYTASQGHCVGRSGQIFVDIDSDGSIQIGGRCVTTMDGTLTA